MINGMVILSVKVHSIEPKIDYRPQADTVPFPTKPNRRQITHKKMYFFFLYLIHIILDRAYYYQCEENYFDFPLIPRCSNAIVIQN